MTRTFVQGRRFADVERFVSIDSEQMPSIGREKKSRAGAAAQFADARLKWPGIGLVRTNRGIPDSNTSIRAGADQLAATRRKRYVASGFLCASNIARDCVDQ